MQFIRLVRLICCLASVVLMAGGCNKPKSPPGPIPLVAAEASRGAAPTGTQRGTAFLNVLVESGRARARQARV